MRLSSTPRLRTALAALAATLAAVPFALAASAQPASAAVPSPPSGFSLTWSDDFTGPAGTGLSASTWKYDTGTGFGTGELETMTSSTSNVYQDGAGHLVLKALHSGTDPRAGWTSGRVETQSSSFGAAPGGVVRMESVLQQPNVTTANGAGYWPAFWMLGAGLRSGGTWPSIGEVDVMEDINGRSSVFGTLHCGSNPGGPCNESTGIGSGEHACAGCQTGFHDYAVEIDRSTSPEQIRYYLDGANYFTIKATQVDATTWANAVDHPFFIIYDLAMGGGFPDAFGGGPTSATVSGGAMVIDSVAVYNKGPASGGGTGGGSTGGTTRSATSTIQAESADAQTGTQTEATSDTGGGSDVGWIGNGDSLRFDNVAFGSSALHTINARVASGAGSGVSGTVEVHLDSPTSTPVGTFSVGSTGGWQSWKTVAGSIGSVTGTHTVYLVFRTGSGQDFTNLNWFTFS
jgi:beta-glucanase (GH16 family)